MTYHGFTIAAEQRLHNLLSVEQDGGIGGVVLAHDWTDVQFEFVVCDDSACKHLLKRGFPTVDAARHFIDELKAIEDEAEIKDWKTK